MRDPVRCPYCPSTLERSAYEAHFNSLHKVDIVSGEHRSIMAQPLQAKPKARPGRTPEETLFSKDLEYDQ